jgi:release factor glutamine methyltransferase
MTIEKALRYGVERVGPRDARLFLSHIFGCRASELHLHTENTLDDFDISLYFSFLERRLADEPLQYIIGQWDFFGLTFFTDKRALIPRQETELLVERAMEFIKSRNEKNFRVLDVCTGSGCIALAIANEAAKIICDTNFEIFAADISDDALALAKKNAEHLAKQEEISRVKFVQSDLLGAFENSSENFFDLIISNPPYILSGEMSTLPPDVRNHEPHLALNGGTDGLDFYRRLIPQSKNALREGGALFLEIGPPSVTDLMHAAGFKNVNLFNDYAGIERIVSGEIHT